MKRALFLSSMLLFLCAGPCFSQPLTRMVFFNLKHEAGSPEAHHFLKSAWVLADIPSLSGFNVLSAEGKQFDYDYVIQLEFEDESHVQEYVDHQIHKDFLKEEWPANVSEGMLIDLKELPTP